MIDQASANQEPQDVPKRTSPHHAVLHACGPMMWKRQCVPGGTASHLSHRV